MAELTLEEKYENMKREYRQTQKELNELRRVVKDVCKSFDGYRARELYEEDLMPSREWLNRLTGLGHFVAPPKFPERKWSRRHRLQSLQKKK